LRISLRGKGYLYKLLKGQFSHPVVERKVVFVNRPCFFSRKTSRNNPDQV